MKQLVRGLAVLTFPMTKVTSMERRLAMHPMMILKVLRGALVVMISWHLFLR